MESDARDTAQRVVMAPEKPSAPSRGVYARMAREGYAFDFFQAVRLLEVRFSEEVGAQNPARESIRFRPHVGLVFPAADVKKITWPDGSSGPAEVIATFMGLYGIDSPLPDAFYDTLATEAEGTFVHRDFLDIFNHRLYASFYRAWKKYRPPVGEQVRTNDAHERRFLSLAGLGTPHASEALPVPPLRLASLAGWLGRRTKCAEGLEAVVKTVFGLPTRVIENVPRWVRLNKRPKMGSNKNGLRLGQSATIGERVYDRASKFRVQVGPLGLEDYVALLPGGARADAMHRVIRLYAPDYLAFDVELRVHANEMPSTRLGDRAAKLGLTTCLGKPTTRVISRTVAYES